MSRGPSAAEKAAIRLASLLVPRALRADWREEWQAELWHARADGASRREVLRAVRGVWRDAFALRRHLGPAAGVRRNEKLLGASAMMNEARLALRGFLRNPGFTFLALLTLALGIGANAALFTVVDSVLLRPLDYRDANDLVSVHHPLTARGGGPWGLSAHGFFFFEDENAVFEDIGVYRSTSLNLAMDGRPDRARGALVSASLLRALGARPSAGRLLQDADNAPGAPNVVVLGREFAERRYPDANAIVGNTMRVNGLEMEVVGIAEAGLALPRQDVDIWLALDLDRGSRPVNSHIYQSVARLRNGVNAETATANVAELTRRLPEAVPEAYSETFMQDYGFTGEVVPLRDEVVANASKTLWIVFGGVGIVLLIACANVANLFLVRAEGRSREVAVRSALGASRGHLTRQFLTESMLIALLAGVLALFLAWGGVRALLALAPTELPRLADVAMRGSTVLFTLIVALFAGLLFGFFPLANLGDRRRAAVLRDGGTRTTANRSRHRLRGALVVAQVALALVLLTGAGLMIRSFQQLRAVEPGYDPAGALTFDVSLTPMNYQSPSDANRFWTELLTVIRETPGVTNAAVTSTVPLKDGAPCSVFVVRDRPLPPGESPPCIEVVWVTPELFSTMGIPIEGREFRFADVDPPTGVAIVSRALAELTWPGESAIGRGVVSYRTEPPFYDVVGVAGDVRLGRLEDPATPLLYLPMVPPAAGGGWGTVRSATVVVRTSLADPTALTTQMRAAIAAVDPEIPMANVQTLDDVVTRSLSRVSFVMLLLGIAASVALLLGTVGLYGMVAFVVNERRTEIGIRMALGARVGEIVRMVIGQALRLAGLGIACGAIATLATGRLLESQLFGVSESDPVTMVGVGVLLIAVAALAAWVPARRASRVDPVETIRAA